MGKFKALTTEEFVRCAKLTHGDKYNYDKVIYVHSRKKVEIVCPIHGSFLQEPASHLRGRGCFMCGKSHKIDGKEFIKRAVAKHGNKYDYSLVSYTNSTTKVKIVCRNHGEFEMRPADHLIGQGCPMCKAEKTGEFFCKTQDDFIKDAYNAHGDDYIYDKAVYVNNDTKVCITCPKHGDFWQTPHNHISLNQGCPLCASYKGEKRIAKFLKLNNIKNIMQYRIKNETSFSTNKMFRVDFYLPDYNLFIEYNGRQHYDGIDYFGGKEAFKRLQKKRHCFENVL